MFLKKNVFLFDAQMLVRCALGILFLLAIALRISLYSVETSDYALFLSPWYDFIQTHGGFAALKYNFSNYNPPYLYLLVLATYIPIAKLAAIKTISVVFDGVLSLFTYLILNLKYRRYYIPIIGALVIAFAPTILINSSLWGQCDAIYTAFCLGSLYFLLKERPAWACIFFGLAISFKLQAIFFLPVLLILLLRRKLPIKYFILIPAIFLLMLVPAFIVGRDAQSLLAIYVGQVNSGGVVGVGRFSGRGAGQFPGRGTNPFPGGTGQFFRGGTNPFPGGRIGQFPGGRFGGNGFSLFTINAPTFYQWLPANAPDYWKWIGILLAAMVVISVYALVVASKKQLTTDILLKTALVFAVAIPFFLPEMHERYFYLADAVSIVYVFWFPRSFYIAIIIQLCSLLSYAPFLLHTQVVNLAYVAFAVLIVTIITVTDLVLTLYPNIRKRPVLPGPLDDEAPPKAADEKNIELV